MTPLSWGVDNIRLDALKEISNITIDVEILIGNQCVISD